MARRGKAGLAVSTTFKEGSSAASPMAGRHGVSFSVPKAVAESTRAAEGVDDVEDMAVDWHGPGETPTRSPASISLQRLMSPRAAGSSSMRRTALAASPCASPASPMRRRATSHLSPQAIGRSASTRAWAALEDPDAPTSPASPRQPHASGTSASMARAAGGRDGSSGSSSSTGSDSALSPRQASVRVKRSMSRRSRKVAVAEGADDASPGPGREKTVGFFDNDDDKTSVSGRSSMSRSTMSSAWSSKSRDEEKDWTFELTNLTQVAAVRALGRSASGRLPGAEQHAPIKADPHSASASDEEWGWDCGGTSSAEEDVWLPGYVFSHMADHMLKRKIWDGKDPVKEGEEGAEGGEEGEEGEPGSVPASPGAGLGKDDEAMPGTPGSRTASRQASRRGLLGSSSAKFGSASFRSSAKVGGASFRSKLPKSQSMRSGGGGSGSDGEDMDGSSRVGTESDVYSEDMDEDEGRWRVVYRHPWSGLEPWSAALEPMRDGTKRWRLRMAAAPENWRFRKPRPGMVGGLLSAPCHVCMQTMHGSCCPRITLPAHAWGPHVST